MCCGICVDACAHAAQRCAGFLLYGVLHYLPDYNGLCRDPMARVVLKGVSKVFDNGYEAVANASFTVEDGELAVLVGPSGCGKSTMLRMLAGLERVTAGEISIGERLVNEVTPKDRDIAMVFQNYALYPHMTVFDNMAFGLKLRKYPKKEIESRVEQAAEVLGIKGILSRKPKQLSGGQQQRVAVGRAIVRKPQVFLFDEPLSNLDAKLRMQMRTEITKLHRRLQATMIYVTHDQVEAMTMGDKIVVMNDGQVQQIDTPLNLYNSPANVFVAGFIGSPSMNLIAGTCSGQDDARFESSALSVALPRNKLPDHAMELDIFLGFRPEHLYIRESADAPPHAITLATLKITLVEPLGHETVIYGNVEDTTIIARSKIPVPPAPGDILHLLVDPSRLHYFDANSGAAIGR